MRERPSVAEEPADYRPPARNTPHITSAAPATWKPPSASPRKATASVAPNSGIRWMKTPARLGPMAATTRTHSAWASADYNTAMNATAAHAPALAGRATPLPDCHANNGSIQSVPASTEQACTASGGTSGGRRLSSTE